MAVLDRWSRSGANLIGLLLALLALYTAGLGTLAEFFHRGLVLGLAGVAVALMCPLAPAGGRRGLRVAFWGLDAIIVLGFVASILWFLHLSESLWSGLYILSKTDLAFAGVGLLTLLELTRRAVGLPLALLAGAAIVYALLGDHLPWIFRHAGYSFEATAQTVWYSLDGVFGLAAAVMVTLVFIYVVFGAVLEGTGAGDVLLRIASRATARQRGGPGHAAVAASGMFGTISGSVTANVVGTGVFTIGMMKKRGFTPAFAGGVEAAASSGGQFLPPVMGAAAFLMAELVGIDYLTICLAALLPALFYLASLFCGVWLEAAKRGLTPSPTEAEERLTSRDLVQSALLVVPIAIIIFMLIRGRSPALAGFDAIVGAIVIALVLNPHLRRNPLTLLKALAAGGIAGARVMVAVGAIGILIGVLNLTGLGMRLSEVILSLGGGTLLGSLFMTMVASLVLGMGLPTLPAYLVIVLLVGPALEQLGVPLLASHLFVMYFGVFSAITPPVALAAFAAAPIAGASATAIGLQALRLAAAGFIIPFVFVYNPELLIIFAHSPLEIGLICLRLVLAIWLLSTAFARYELRKLSLAESGCRVVAALALLFLGWPWQLMAAIVGTGLVAVAWLRQPQSKITR